MNSILTETLEGRIAYADLINANENDFSYSFKGGVGVIHEKRIFINYDEIFWGETEDNPARKKGSSKKNIKGLATPSIKSIKEYLTIHFLAVNHCSCFGGDIKVRVSARL